MKGGLEAQPVYTIGHSTRTLEEFVKLLQTAGIALLMDVRSIRRSRTNPGFNEDILPQSLSEFGIGYTPVPELGGRRARQKSVPEQVNDFWQNRSFHNYADYAMSAEFAIGLRRLLSQSETTTCALMCAEAVWWRCHRRIIADYLLLHGRVVLHIMGSGRIEPASMTRSAAIAERVLTYPAAA